MEDFVEIARLYKELGGAPRPHGWSDQERDAVSGRFHQLMSVWLDEPLTAAGFRRSSAKWVLGTQAVRPIVEVQRRRTFGFQGAIVFTVNWGVWVEPFACHLGRSRRPRPTTSTAPFAARIGELLPGEEDVWWAVLTKGVIRTGGFPRREGDPTADDEVPRVLRQRLIPMLTPVTSVKQALLAIENWRSEGFTPSTIHIAVDPLVALRRVLEETEADA